MNTRRPNANPEPLEGRYDGTRDNPTTASRNQKAIYDTEKRDSVRYIPTGIAPQEDYIAPGKIGVYDRFNNRRGTMGMRASAATAARFLDERHAPVDLKKVDGKHRWQERGGAVTRQAQGALNREVHAASVRASRGSAKPITDPTASGGQPLSPSGRHRGQSPEVLTGVNRGRFRP